jgi:hypothetical protein
MRVEPGPPLTRLMEAEVVLEMEHTWPLIPHGLSIILENTGGV